MSISIIYMNRVYKVGIGIEYDVIRVSYMGLLPYVHMRISGEFLL